MTSGEVIEKRRCLKLAKRLMQNCPLCNEPQVICQRGVVRDLETQETHVAHDKGYSFCNCRNIFYTDWKNIKMEIYDELFLQRYDAAPNPKSGLHGRIKACAERYWKKLVPFLPPDPISLVELGSTNDILMDVAQEKGEGMVCIAIDLIPRKSKHGLITVNFEDYESKEKTDIIWASQVFEHFHYPGKALDKCRDMLKDNGVLLISMPDTIFIDFENNITDWAWGVEEHHILWNMYNWIEYVEEHGFKCVYKERTTDIDPPVKGKQMWHWQQDMLTIFKKDDSWKPSL